MTVTELLVSQATDPFRIGLMAALVFTTFRQRAATGLVLPLALGAVFFAVLLPTVMVVGSTVPVTTQIATGLVVNAGWIAVMVAAWTAFRRFRR
ncbi:MAG: hypothetical protein ACT4OK_13510 [Gemmobacter sp.]